MDAIFFRSDYDNDNYIANNTIAQHTQHVTAVKQIVFKKNQHI